MKGQASQGCFPLSDTRYVQLDDILGKKVEKQEERKRKAVTRPDIDYLSECNDSSRISYTKYLRHKVFTIFVFSF